MAKPTKQEIASAVEEWGMENFGHSEKIPTRLLRQAEHFAAKGRVFCNILPNLCERGVRKHQRTKTFGEFLAIAAKDRTAMGGRRWIQENEELVFRQITGRDWEMVDTLREVDTWMAIDLLIRVLTGKVKGLDIKVKT